MRKGETVFSFTFVDKKKNTTKNFVALVSYPASIYITTHHSQRWIQTLFLEKMMNGHKERSSVSI